MRPILQKVALNARQNDSLYVWTNN